MHIQICILSDILVQTFMHTLMHTSAPKCTLAHSSMLNFVYKHKTRSCLPATNLFCLPCNLHKVDYQSIEFCFTNPTFCTLICIIICVLVCMLCKLFA